MEPRTCRTCEHWGNARNPCKDCWPSDRTSWIADKDKKIAELEVRIKELEAERAAMFSSVKVEDLYEDE